MRTSELTMKEVHIFSIEVNSVSVCCMYENHHTRALMSSLQLYLLGCYFVELDELRREKRELEESCRVLEQQLQHQQDHSNSEQHRQLESRRRRQEELERRIHILEQQKKNLISKTEEVSDL